MGTDSPGGAVDGVRGEVNDACMFWGAECPRTCECGDVICQQVAGVLPCHPSIWKERAVGCQHRLRGGWGENAGAEGMNGVTHGAYTTRGARWME